MTEVLKTKSIIRDVITNSKEINRLLPKVLSVLSERPFNMKGQESEELFAYLLKSELEKKFGEDNVKIIVPGNKKLSDIMVYIPKIEEGFELKFYGGSNRAQLSTLKNILDDIRDKFNSSSNGLLNLDEKKWLISKISKESFDYNLSFFVKKINNSYDVSIFDFDSLDISSFINFDFELKKVGKENRTEIFIKLSDRVSIEICSGRNALNRGIWIKGIKTSDDLNIIDNHKYIKILLQKSINFDFDKDIFMMERAKKTLELIESI